MKTITGFLLSKAEECPDILPPMQELADKIEWLANNSRSLKEFETLEPSAGNRKLLGFATDSLKESGELLTLEQKDYKAYIFLLAYCPEDFAFFYLKEKLVVPYIEQNKLDELLFFTDMLRQVFDNHRYLSGVYNWVCDYFFQARREAYHGKGSYITDEQFRRAERNLKYLRQRSFREMVQIKGYKVYSPTVLAKCCDMEYSSFRRRFKAEFGKTVCQWIREQRAKEIAYLLEYTDKRLLEIAENTGFSSASNLNDFCVKYMLGTPGVLRKRLKGQRNVHREEQCDE